MQLLACACQRNFFAIQKGSLYLKRLGTAGLVWKLPTEFIVYSFLLVHDTFHFLSISNQTSFPQNGSLKKERLQTIKSYIFKHIVNTWIIFYVESIKQNMTQTVSDLLHSVICGVNTLVLTDLNMVWTNKKFNEQ
jgi:hypothetical protein